MIFRCKTWYADGTSQSIWINTDQIQWMKESTKKKCSAEIHMRNGDILDVEQDCDFIGRIAAK